MVVGLPRKAGLAMGLMMVVIMGGRGWVHDEGKRQGAGVGVYGFGRLGKYMVLLMERNRGIFVLGAPSAGYP